MSKEATSKMGSSCSDSISFPNTVIQSGTFEMGSTVFRFKPVKSDVLLKQLLEEMNESPKSEKKTPKHKTSNIIPHRRKYANIDSFSSDEDIDQNILDKTITEDDSVLNNKDLVPGISWLNSSPERKPLKIITKPVLSTPLTNMFSKLSIRDQHSARKEPRSVSVDRKVELELPQTLATNNIFKTPVCKNLRTIPSGSTAQKLYSSDRSAMLSTNNQLSARKMQLELATPKQKLQIQPNKILETPQQSSILQAAIHRDFNTPRPTLPSSTKEDRIISSSSKKSDVVLREKNLNVVGLQRQRSKEVIHEEKQTPNKYSTNNEIKHVPNKQSIIKEIKQPSNYHSGFNEKRQHSNNQSSISEARKLPNKQLYRNDYKQSTIRQESQLPNKQLNSNEYKQSSINEANQLPNKQLNSNEYKQSSISEANQLPNKQLNSNEYKQSSISEANQQPNKQLNSNEYKQSSISEASQLPNKQLNNNEYKHSSINEASQLPNKQLNSNEYKQSDVSEERQLTNKQLNNNEFKQSNVNEERQLPNKQRNSNESPQTSNNEEKLLLNKQSSSSELKPTNNEENQLLNKQLINSELKLTSNNEQIQNKQRKPIEVKQSGVQINIPVKSLQESTFQQLKVKGKEYIVINKIGEGGSGQVYRCFEQESLQDRAIKVVNLNVDLATRNSYINEVKMLKELQGNDRVIRMYDFEQINKNLFVVMEKGDVDFSIFLRNFTGDPQIQTHIIVCYWIEMLKCVREIHEQGIIHSDLKPSNFLLVGGRLKLIDFGIASRLNSDMTSIIKNVTVGTFNYISPEALLDSRTTPAADEKPELRISYKSDVWSLGCILYQMVYRRTPFQSIGSIYAKFAKITDRNHKIEYKEIPGVPLYLIDMIKKCLVYDMRSRPTVEELLKMYYSGNYY